ncbi:MAG: C39 family peptidase, partial [bacterium]
MFSFRIKMISLLVLISFCISLSIAFAKMEKDSDKDGLSDREELVVYKSDIANPDTDNDGYKDGEEVYHGFSPIKDNRAPLKKVSLSVPYIPEAPDNNWTGSWKNACEEASIAMVEYYYRGFEKVDKATAKSFMSNLFFRQNSIYGSNADADAKRTDYLIKRYYSFHSQIIDKPTVEQIKKELQQKRPVITMHYGFDLDNKNIPFLRTGSSYHMMVIIGYDDDKKEFIVNDPGDMKTGQQHRYNYSLFMNTLHDFNFKSRKADGPARVIFTQPKLVKLPNSGRIYFID